MRLVMENMHTDIVDKITCLNLNANWQPVGFKTVREAIVGLCGSGDEPKCLALDIDYNIKENGDPDLSKIKNINPVNWKEWLALPIRNWDLTISSPNLTIRVPTVIIALNYNKMPYKSFKGKPTKQSIYIRDKGICQYTGKKLTRDQSSIDHIIPKSRGGDDEWTNMVLCERSINYKKGNNLNGEIGLNLLKPPTIPKPMPMYALIKEAKHIDWKHFLIP